MHEGVVATSALMTEALKLVQARHSFFRRSNGRDHFMVASYDHGRCSSMTFVSPKLAGELFTLQLNGDRRISSRMGDPVKGIQEIAFNPGAEYSKLHLPETPCYIPGHDVVIPVLAEGAITDPQSGERSIKLLARFGRAVLGANDKGKPTLHHGHAVRKELWDIFEEQKPLGWEFGLTSDEHTLADMRNSKFCACPPGYSQWTSRITKAILAGCIPVTSFREHDQPWQDEIDYSSFSLNIDPGEITTTPHRINGILADETAFRAMQQALAKVQPWFAYNESVAGGVHERIVHTLQRRATALADGTYKPTWQRFDQLKDITKSG
eukprot:SM000008S22375  [mRNA]  locus=s8:1378949:1381162:+ [translate_table: standard]